MVTRAPWARLLFLLVLTCSAWVPRATKLYAIGDLHGDYRQAVAVFKALGIVDVTGVTWAVGNATVVQMGDMVNRGSDDEEILTLIRSLQDQAEAAGGNWVVMMANHEMMSILGWWDYSVDALPDVGFGTLERRAYELGPNRPLGQWIRALPGVFVKDGILFNHAGLADPALARLGAATINARLTFDLLRGDDSSDTAYKLLWCRQVLFFSLLRLVWLWP